MNNKRLPLFIGLGVLGILLIWAISSYNGMVSANNDVEGQWGNVQNAYQRRKDLIPNLVNTVKGAASFEKDTYIGVTQARRGELPAAPAAPPIEQSKEFTEANAAVAKAGSFNPTAAELTPENVNKYNQLQTAAKTSIDNLFNITVERYPDLKATQNFTKLQDQLEGTENRIKTERDKFNETAKGYNNKVQSFPGNIVAGLFGFKVKGYFEADADAATAPKVEF